MNHLDVLQDLKRKVYQPVYFLHGEESFFIDLIADQIEHHVLSDAEKGFNQTVLYGKDSDHQAVTDTARRYPMMAPRQVVILKEAQQMEDLEELVKYVQRPSETTILVICYKHKSFKKFNSAFGKALRKNAVVLESKKLYQEKVPEWILKYGREMGLEIQEDVAVMLSEYLGTDLSKISNELGKMALNLEKGASVSTQDVETYVGISKEYNVFELQKALAARNRHQSLRIIHNLASNMKRNPFIMIVGVLTNFFSKVYMLQFMKNHSREARVARLGFRSPWFLKDYELAVRNYSLAETQFVIALLSEYDLKAKGINFNGTNTGDEELLRELGWRILNGYRV